jgi:hypothetical protein
MAAAKPPREWLPYEQRLCDLCDRIAWWAHPLGAYRCRVCPKPTTTAPPKKRSKRNAKK